MLRKRLLAVLLVAAFLAGGVAGWCARRLYPPPTAPPGEATVSAPASPAEDTGFASRMVVGTATRVEPTSIALRVREGKWTGTTAEARADSDTYVVVGAETVKKKGGETDLTRWFKPGDTVGVVFDTDFRFDRDRETLCGKALSVWKPAGS
ncbi:hypothetical protein Adeg_0785 [Ammonifex degensii KC4]|uniref:Uncharacterized protein n=1 Tax=Ammonifex degensii (strain DSM 10501 / KC4) TaxID=429009 RepID=C9RCF1_AMMDK|nr:hypothetical protein [Ammonifex degensii]ACX51928.1 hypothetical protein Adeg_0785 [Ammonifex degensii KC4]